MSTPAKHREKSSAEIEYICAAFELPLVCEEKFQIFFPSVMSFFPERDPALAWVADMFPHGENLADPPEERPEGHWTLGSLAREEPTTYLYRLHHGAYIFEKSVRSEVDASLCRHGTTGSYNCADCAALRSQHKHAHTTDPFICADCGTLTQLSHLRDCPVCGAHLCIWKECFERRNAVDPNKTALRADTVKELSGD